jgi:hypothetical protein
MRPNRLRAKDGATKATALASKKPAAKPTSVDFVRVALMGRIADLEIALADVIGIHNHVGGFMRAEHQTLLRRAIRVRAGAELTSEERKERE